MLGTAADRLHGSPHIAIARNQVPARLNEITCFDLAAKIKRLRSTGVTIRQHPCPHNISITLHHSMSATEFPRFLGIKRSVNTAENYVSATFSCQLPNFISA